MKRDNLFAVAVILLSWLLVYFIYVSPTQNLLKIALALLVLYLGGKYAEKKFKLQGELVFLLWKSQKGIELVKKIAERFEKQLKFLADAAMFPAFGLLSLVLIDWKTMKSKIYSSIVGLLILVGVGLIYSPSMAILLTKLGIGSGTISAGTGNSLSEYFPFITLLFGMAATALLSLVLSALKVGYALFQLILGNQVVVHQTATLLLPGINLPFLEGIIALGIILIVHEFSHGFLAILHKIKVKSMGIVTFGTLPVGAFVEPDDKKLLSAGKKANVRVALAGIGANFIFGIIIFGLLLLFLNATQMFASNSCLLVSEEKIFLAKHVEGCFFSNSIESIDGKIYQLDQNQLGKVKITELDNSDMLRYYSNPILQFIYNVLVLSASLNLVVGVINLLPIPFFDGNRLFQTLFSKEIFKACEIIALGALVLSLIPSIL